MPTWVSNRPTCGSARARYTGVVDATRIFLQRHGAVDSAWQGRIYGALDVPLSARGRAEGERAAERLAGIDLAAVISSGLARAEHGAACLRATRRTERIDDPALRELERGEWAGLTLSELERRSPGAWEAWGRAPDTSRPPGGESLIDLHARVRPRIAAWARPHAGRALAIVTHGWVIRVLVCEALGLSLARARHLDVRTGDLVVLRCTPDARACSKLDGFACDVVPPA